MIIKPSLEKPFKPSETVRTCPAIKAVMAIVATKKAGNTIFASRVKAMQATVKAYHAFQSIFGQRRSPPRVRRRAQQRMKIMIPSFLLGLFSWFIELID